MGEEARGALEERRYLTRHSAHTGVSLMRRCEETLLERYAHPGLLACVWVGGSKKSGWHTEGGKDRLMPHLLGWSFSHVDSTVKGQPRPEELLKTKEGVKRVPAEVLDGSEIHKR